MDISGIITALIVGVIVGALGRLVLPGKQAIGVILTILVGIVAAFIGLWIAASLLGTESFILTLIIQVALAAIGVAIVAGAMGASNRNSRV